MERTGTQRRILETALRLFSINGYRTTTTRDIAADAGVNELTIFRNFGSKENLLSEVIDHGIDAEGIKEYMEIGTTDDLEQDLLEMVSRVKVLIRERESIYALMFREMSSNDVVREKLQSIPGRMKQTMISELSRIMGSRERDDIDIETAGVFLISYFLRSEMMRILLGSDPFQEPDEKRTAEVISIFLDGYVKEAEQ